MFVVYRQDGFAEKPKELYHTDHKELAEKYKAEYEASHPEKVLIFITEEAGKNTRANAAKEDEIMAKRNAAAGGK